MRAILFGLGASAATFVASAIVLAVLDIYRAGHGSASPMERSFIARGAVQLSVADALALGASAVAGVLAFVLESRSR